MIIWIFSAKLSREQWQTTSKTR